MAIHGQRGGGGGGGLREYLMHLLLLGEKDREGSGEVKPVNPGDVDYRDSTFDANTQTRFTGTPAGGKRGLAEASKLNAAGIQHAQQQAGLLAREKELSQFNKAQAFQDFVARNQEELKQDADKSFVELYKVLPAKRPDLYKQHIINVASQAFDTHLATLQSQEAVAKNVGGSATRAEEIGGLTRKPLLSAALAKARTEQGLAAGAERRVPLTNRALDVEQAAKPIGLEQELYKGQFVPLHSGMSYNIRDYNTGNNQLLSMPKELDPYQEMTMHQMGLKTPGITIRPFSTTTFSNGAPMPIQPGSPVDNLLQRSFAPTTTSPSFISTDEEPTRKAYFGPAITAPAIATPPPAETPYGSNPGGFMQDKFNLLRLYLLKNAASQAGQF